MPHRNQAKYPRIEVSSSRFSSKDLDHAKGYSEPDITVCKTDLPNFGVSNSYSAAVFARWTRNDVSKSENDNSAPRERTEIHTSNSASGDIIVGRKSQTNSGHVFSRHCGDIVLKAEDVISGKYEINVFTHSDPYDVEMQDLKGEITINIQKIQTPEKIAVIVMKQGYLEKSRKLDKISRSVKSWNFTKRQGNFKYQESQGIS